MTAGTYEEQLPCSGTMRVSKDGWEVRYYFAGPDLRHKGTVVTVPGASVEDYIRAFDANFAEFENLKLVIPANSDFSKQVARGMTIRIGAFNQGVCIQSYHMPIATATHLKRVTDGYRYAKQRAPDVQKFLASL